MTSNKRILFAGLAIALTAGGAANAQSARGALAQASDTSSNFRRDRNIAVRQRPHEGYEALGVRAGAFMAWPKLTTTVEHNDNVYATAVNEQDDIVAHVVPEVVLTSTWSRHMVQAFARAQIHRFKDLETENTEEYSVGAQGRLDVLRSFQVRGGADWSRLVEPRTSSASPTNTLEPIRYELSTANIGAIREFNRLRVSGRFDVRRFDYENGVTTTGAPVLQDDRDRSVYTVTGRAEYAVSPDTALFAQVSGNTRAYRLNNPSASLYPAFVNRDSEGYEALVGANFELSALVRGELGVGYLHQEFDDPRFNEIDGLGARAQVEWFPTQLVTVTLTGSRTVEDAGIIGSSGYLSSNLGAQLDYELLRNVIVGAQASYGNDDYEGIDREDKRFVAGVSATYLMNRNVGLTVGVTHFEQESDGAAGGQDFEVNRVGATLTLQY
ncbi:outer membrane beta-barrel protein [Phenylobacterium deserti]|uniref:Outer membrane beta-barrel protein n=1 Tax=Phenylobacterium deserti TaxID=1914756 RepID=A0A328AGS0_9CAUL|nr:outer membrane beta-barrel protein [Phenylobacterium deserti]RAK52644.1 hypothetical protein DJ018_10595 [Phenylobacterium deserti]